MRKLTVLVSYFYIQRDPRWNDVMEACSPYIDWMVDSGGFSDFMMAAKAAKKGQPYTRLELQDYITWLHQHKQSVWNYVAMDVVRQPKLSNENYKVMWDEGLLPMPVLTAMHPVESVVEWVERYRWLCMAGVVDGAAEWIVPRLREIHRLTGDKARVHALGMSRWPELVQWPMHSADSSSWLSGARYGTLTDFQPGRGLMQMNTPKDVASYLTRTNSPTQRSAWTGGHGVPSVSTMSAYLKMADFAATIDGRRSFLAVSAIGYFGTMMAVAESMRELGRYNYIDARRRLLEMRKRTRHAKTDVLCHAIASAAQNVFKLTPTIQLSD